MVDGRRDFSVFLRLLGRDDAGVATGGGVTLLALDDDLENIEKVLKQLKKQFKINDQ